MLWGLFLIVFSSASIHLYPSILISYILGRMDFLYCEVLPSAARKSAFSALLVSLGYCVSADWYASHWETNQVLRCMYNLLNFLINVIPFVFSLRCWIHRSSWNTLQPVVVFCYFLLSSTHDNIIYRVKHLGILKRKKAQMILVCACAVRSFLFLCGFPFYAMRTWV